MRTLLLLRHAKSSWEDSSLADHDRPLNARGREAATRMGRYLREEGLCPELVLCSTAQRARETLECALEALERPMEVELLRDLYLANANRLARCIAGVPRDVCSLLVVAHNPGVAQLAARLAAAGCAQSRERLRRKFPTGALARLRCETPSWSDLANRCELAAFVAPRDLGR